MEHCLRILGETTYKGRDYILYCRRNEFHTGRCCPAGEDGTPESGAEPENVIAQRKRALNRDSEGKFVGQ